MSHNAKNFGTICNKKAVAKWLRKFSLSDRLDIVGRFIRLDWGCSTTAPFFTAALQAPPGWTEKGKILGKL
jgi:hypothetical protein